MVFLKRNKNSFLFALSMGLEILILVIAVDWLPALGFRVLVLVEVNTQNLGSTM